MRQGYESCGQSLQYQYSKRPTEPNSFSGHRLRRRLEFSRQVDAMLGFQVKKTVHDGSTMTGGLIQISVMNVLGI